MAALVATPPPTALGRDGESPQLGVVTQTPITAAEFEAMRAGGVRTFRWSIMWAAVQSRSDGPLEWARTDHIVAELARNDIEPLPVLFGSPCFAVACPDPDSGRARPEPPTGTPAARLGWARFVNEAVRRYGREGSFWSQHPSLPYRPVTAWQVWNEPNAPQFYRPAPSVEGYADLLGITSRAIRDADPRAVVVLGGMPVDVHQRRAIRGDRFLADLYRIGAADDFDVVAVHPYSRRLPGVRAQVAAARGVVERLGRTATPIWVTELGWGVASDPTQGLFKTLEGQARALTRSFSSLAAKRRAWEVERIMWYAWRDTRPGQPACDWCRTAGLIDAAGDPRPSWPAIADLVGGTPVDPVDVDVGDERPLDEGDERPPLWIGAIIALVVVIAAAAWTLRRRGGLPEFQRRRVLPLASVPHRLRQERAAASPIVLPLTSRGIALTDRVCWGILGVAMALAVALILYLGRGTTYFYDEVDFLYATPGLGIGDVLDPHNGHLIATTRLVYKAVLEALGPDYVAFRLLGVATVLLAAGLFYALVKRSIGALPALAPTLVLLVLGSAWQHVVVPIGFTPMLAIAAGLASLLALERGDRRGDVAACALLVFSAFTYTSGLPFIVGAAIAVLLRPERVRRAWIFLVPLTLYAAWWAWSQSEPSSSADATRVANALLIPVWSAESLAVGLASVTGLSFGFASSGPFVIDPTWGRPLAVVAVAALVLRVKKGGVPVALWVALGIVLTWWALGAISLLRIPESVRFTYFDSAGVLLAAAAAAGAMRFSRVGLAVLFAVCAVSIATNIALLRDGARVFRGISEAAQAEFTMLELARDHVDPSFKSVDVLGNESALALASEPASDHFAVVDRYGSLATPLSELEGESEVVRTVADRVLAAALELRLEPGAPPIDARRCERVRGPGRTRTVEVQLPRGGATLRTSEAGAAPVTVGRFADGPAAEVGTVQPRQATTLRIPTDASPKPWRASLSGVGSLTVCPLR